MRTTLTSDKITIEKLMSIDAFKNIMSGDKFCIEDLMNTDAIELDLLVNSNRYLKQDNQKIEIFTLISSIYYTCYAYTISR